MLAAVLQTACVLWLARWLERRWRAPMKSLRARLEQLADGNLAELDWTSSADGAVQSDLKRIGELLFEIVLQVRAGTAALAGTANFIASDNQALLQSTERQTEALTSTAATMEQLTATVQMNAAHAEQAHALSTKASMAARQGGEVTDRVVASMGTIMESSKRVEEIIAVIDGIAFQTNILALNAAVEAARAGEQGRGFSVVAAEVRALAQRSATAAKEIKTLIQDSVQRISSGNIEVAEAGAVIKDVIQHIQGLATLMSEISSASREQSAGIVAVNDAMAQIDTMTERNTSLVETTAKTARGLTEQAHHLAQIVAKVRLGEREFGSRDEAIAMVKAALAFAHGQGAQALVDEVRQLNRGRFVDRDLYCSLYDLNAICLANGANPRYVGIDGKTFKDADGRYFVKEIVDQARRSGSGWVAYKHPHPLSKVVQNKTTYFERYEDMVVSCGIYDR